MKSWKVAEKTPEVEKLAQEAGLSPTIAQLLVNRKIKGSFEAQKFLYPLRKYLYEPKQLADLEPAVERVREAIAKKEKVLLFGDYDVDGVTSLAMLSDYLTRRGLESQVVIPCRIHEGYGFNSRTLDQARKDGVSLIIAVDCGTNSKVLEKAKLSSGIDVIVVDHHQVFTRKRSFFLINPKRGDCPYPFKFLPAGVLVFKLIWGLKNVFPYEYLDQATLSIVCDVAPLIDENRILVKAGLEKMRSDPSIGVESLMESNSLRKENIDTFHLGWILGPRLNASGRVAKAYPSFKLLASSSKEEARELVAVLDKNNKDRRIMTQSLLSEAMAKVEAEVDLGQDYVIVLSEEDWHIGILGIVASNIKEKFSRPAFLISVRDGLGKGSGRSIEGFHMIKALDKCQDFLKEYGGHKKACGISIDKDQIKDFRRAINRLAKDALEGKDLISRIDIDAEISFSMIAPDILEPLRLFSPFGEANPEPLFCTRNLSVKNITDYRNSDRLVWFEESLNDKSFVYPAVVSKRDKVFDFIEYGGFFDIVYHLRQAQSEPHILLKLKDIRIT